MTDNFCRNPSDHTGIWCYTTNKLKRWDNCDPIEVVEESDDGGDDNKIEEQKTKTIETGNCNDYTQTQQCVTGENMLKLNKVTRKECQYTCSHTEGCLGIEYFSESDAADREDLYKEFDCNLSSSLDTTDCDAKKWQLSLWVKKDPIQCNENYMAQHEVEYEK